MFQWLRLLPYRNLPVVQASDIFNSLPKSENVRDVCLDCLDSILVTFKPLAFRSRAYCDCNPIRAFEIFDISKEPISKTSIFCMFWYKRCCNWLGAMKGMALWSRGFSRGSLFRTWPKPETAHEKSLAPRVPIESNSTSNCRQPPCRKCTFPPFLRLVLDLFLFCTTTCTHSCLKSLYFLPFLNPLNNRYVWPAIVCKPVLFAHNRF